MLSGIDPVHHLEKIGVKVRHDFAGADSRLYDHPQMPMKYELHESSLSLARYQRANRVSAIGINYYLFRGDLAVAQF